MAKVATAAGAGAHAAGPSVLRVGTDDDPRLLSSHIHRLTAE
jgi:hypothetical protein